jgi:CPA2 family monovalent cation:H+ antiporter-2
MPEVHLLQDLLVLFVLGILAVVAFHRFNLPPVLGFLLTGIICGPHGFRLIDSTHQVEELAELGVVLLLFTIGIEFSFTRLKALKRFLLLGGGLQVGVTILFAAVLTHLTGMSWSTGAFIGMLVAMSSTVIVIRLMQHRGELDSAHGNAALTILVFQDLCIVPMVLITPFLGGKSTDFSQVPLLMGKALLFVVLAVSIARFLVPWFLNHVANTRKREAFVLSVMLLCLGTAWATSQVGLSMALGAFLAGLVISESKYNHQAMSELLPFRELFNFLVFVSIGMLFDVRTLVEHPLLIVTCLAVVVALKATVASGVTFALGHSLRVALLTGFAIAQASEFSFVLAKVGLDAGVLDQETNQLFMAVAILSMAVTPGAFALAPRVSDWLSRVLPASWTSGRRNEHGQPESMRDHVVIVGFGINGRTVASAVKQLKMPFVVVEMNPASVKAERANGVPIFYGDASTETVLEHAAVAHARLIVLTATDRASMLRCAELARRLNPGIVIVARTRFALEVEGLLDVGADEVVAEECVGSIELLSRVLHRFALSEETIEAALADRHQSLGAVCGGHDAASNAPHKCGGE